MKQVFIFLGFICFTGFSQAGHLDGIPSAEQQRAPLPAVLKQVAPDLHFFYNDASSNSAFLVADAGVLVVDTGQHPAEGRALLEYIRKITDKPVKWVINTHAHGDHYFGNKAFKDAGATRTPASRLR